MSAYDDYAEEKRVIDELLGKGYAIIHVQEGLEGAEALFEKRSDGKDKGESESQASRVKVWLLTAEARKYLSYLVLVQQSEAQ